MNAIDQSRQRLADACLEVARVVAAGQLRPDHVRDQLAHAIEVGVTERADTDVRAHVAHRLARAAREGGLAEPGCALANAWLHGLRPRERNAFNGFEDLRAAVGRAMTGGNA